MNAVWCHNYLLFFAFDELVYFNVLTTMVQLEFVGRTLFESREPLKFTYALYTAASPL